MSGSACWSIETGRVVSRLTSTMRGMEICGLTNCLLSSAEVVNGCVQTHVGLEIDAVTQVVHDLLNTDGKEVPCSLDVVLAWKDRHNSGILRHGCGLAGLSTRAIGRVRVFG
jgi:hypothetical protein